MHAPPGATQRSSVHAFVSAQGFGMPGLHVCFAGSQVSAPLHALPSLQSRSDVQVHLQSLRQPSLSSVFWSSQSSPGSTTLLPQLGAVHLVPLQTPVPPTASVHVVPLGAGAGIAHTCLPMSHLSIEHGLLSSQSASALHF